MNKLQDQDDTNKKLKDQKKKATQKYRRLRTIISKAAVTAKLCNIKLNVVTYDQKLHRLTERYTHDDIKVKDVVKLVMDEQVGLLSRSKKKKTLSFKSQLAMEKVFFKADGEADSDQEDFEGPSRNIATSCRKLLQEYRQSLKELINTDQDVFLEKYQTLPNVFKGDLVTATTRDTTDLIKGLEHAQESLVSRSSSPLSNPHLVDKATQPLLFKR